MGQHTDLTDVQKARQSWMSLLATSAEDRLDTLAKPFVDGVSFDWLRKPETGGVMVRGRAGGTGAPFNVGEMTVTRCSVSLPSGEVGHGYVQGRSKAHAQTAALLDALLQTEQSSDVTAQVIHPLKAEKSERKTTRAEKAAATKVEFFTMVRGED